jgi:hypothetical protein
MSPIITQPGLPAHVHPDEAARKRAARLAGATVEQAEAALAFLSVIDPLMFGIVMDAGDQIVDAPAGSRDVPAREAPEDEEAIPVCRRCAAPVGVFPDRGPQWQHFRGTGTTAGGQQIYDPGHPAEVSWCLPDEGPEEL